jgi:hypothetical protein
MSRGVVSTVRGLSPPWCGAELTQKIIDKHHTHVDRTRQLVHQRAGCMNRSVAKGVLGRSARRQLT